MRSIVGISTLIVEAERSAAESLAERLSHLGVRVVGLTDNLADAAKLARDHRPDLVLLDVRLFEPDGVPSQTDTAAQTVPLGLCAPHILTVPAELDAIRRASSIAPFGYLIKPIEEGELIASLRTALALSAAEQSRIQFTALFEQSLDAVFLTRPTGEILRANPAACRLFGYSEQEFQEKGRALITNWEDERTQQTLQRRDRTGQVRSEVSFRTRDGRIIETEVASQIFPDGRGGTYASVVLHDITERKQLEASLAAAAGRLQTIFDLLPVGLTILDRNRQVLEMNRAIAEILELPPEGVRPFVLGQTRYVHRDGTPFQPHEFASARAFATGGPVIGVETGIVREGRDTLWTSVNAAPLPDGTVVVATSDITHTVRTEEEERQRAHRLQQAQRWESLALLAAGIAHDFNNLLATIYGNIELALRLPPGEVNDRLRRSLETLDRARSLTGQLLVFARGHLPKLERADVAAFLQKTVQFALSGSGIKSTFSVAPGLWECFWDPAQMAQVVENIVINARQAVGNSGFFEVDARNIELRAGELPPLPAGRYVQLSFTDSGPGVPQQIIDRVFDPFFTTKESGSGLGLTTSYAIVRKHGGTIRVHSVPGRLTRFEVILPVDGGGQVDRETPEIPRRAATSSELRGRRILVMDDSAPLLEALAQQLRLLGCVPLLSTGGEQALKLFTENENGRTLDAVILDYTIPGERDGGAICTAMRSLNSEVPIFVVSGYADADVILHPSRFGFTDSLRKPYMLADLEALLVRHTRPRES